jgi:F420-dependent oxidoreductase-like protein
MQGLNIGVHVVAANVPSLLERIGLAEKAGIETAWMTCGGAAPDPLTVFAAAARETSTIEFGTSIIPTFPRHPVSLAQEALVVDQLAPGRLKLGVGPSHKPAMESVYDFNFDKPLQHLRDYLVILNDLLKTGKVSYHGPRLSAVTQMAAPTQVRVMASALRPNAFKLCGELADGGISWVSPMSYLRDVAVPALQEGAAKVGRATPHLVAHVPVVVSQDTAAIRAAAHQQMGFYPRLPFYAAMFVDAGFPEAAEGKFSDAMADSLVVFGDEGTFATRIRNLKAQGADEVIAMILNLPDDRNAWQRTVETLGAVAREA